MSTLKRLSQAICQQIDDEMIVALGTGPLIDQLLIDLAAQLQAGDRHHLIIVPSSFAVYNRALELDLAVVNVDDVPQIDLFITTVDECTPNFFAHKSASGTFLQEKLLTHYSHRTIWALRADQIVGTLGHLPLAVEIVTFGSWKTFHLFEQMGMQPAFRKSGVDNLYRTDENHYVIDLNLGSIAYPYQLAHDLSRVLGVIDHSLYLTPPDQLFIIDSKNTVTIIDPKEEQL